MSVRPVPPAARAARLRVLHVASLLVLAACGGGGGDTTAPPPAPTPTLRVALDVATLSLAQGATGSAGVTLTRGGGFAGAVTLAVNGAPAGITVTPTPTTVAAGSATASLAIAVGASVAPGTYPLRVVGSASGVASDSATLPLTVTAAPAGSVSIAAAPTSLSVTAGGAAATATLTITRVAPFTGAVTLAAAPATGTPAGVQPTVTPNTNVTGTSATLSVSATAATTPGSYGVTVTVSGTGVTAQTITVPVTVAAAPSGQSVTFCAANAPVWLAIQDGAPTATWTRVLPSSANTYTIGFGSGRGGIARVDTIGADFQLSVIYVSAAELANYARSVNFGGCGAKTITGSVANVGAGTAARITLGGDFQTAANPPGSFTFTQVAAGPQTLVGARFVQLTGRVDRLILRRDVDVPNGGTLPTLDFGAAESFAPASFDVTIANPGSGSRSALTSFVGRFGTDNAFLSLYPTVTAGATLTVDALPTAQLQAGEFQQVQAVESGASGLRSASTFFRTIAARTVTLGPALATPTITTAAASPYVRPRVQLPLQGEYDRFISAQFGQAGSLAFIFMTRGYTGTGSAAWDVTMPDLSGVAGWNGAWAGGLGVPLRWTVTGIGGATPFIDASVNEGDTQRSATAISP